jgi:hypothetical protein
MTTNSSADVRDVLVVRKPAGEDFDQIDEAIPLGVVGEAQSMRSWESNAALVAIDMLSGESRVNRSGFEIMTGIVFVIEGCDEYNRH